MNTNCFPRVCPNIYMKKKIGLFKCHFQIILYKIKKPSNYYTFVFKTLSLFQLEIITKKLQRICEAIFKSSHVAFNEPDSLTLVQGSNTG